MKKCAVIYVGALLLGIGVGEINYRIKIHKLKKQLAQMPFGAKVVCSES